MPSILLEFENFPREKALIGEMLIAYGEIEFAIATILGSVFKQDANIAARTLFRVKGEGPRLEVADALLRPALAEANLAEKWDNAYGAAKYCKNIRNQYSHCHWWQEGVLPLCFINMDESAKQRDGTLSINLEPVDLPLIEKQHQYFDYTVRLLYSVHSRYREWAQIFPIPEISEPTSIPQPPRSNPRTLPTRAPSPERT